MKPRTFVLMLCATARVLSGQECERAYANSFVAVEQRMSLTQLTRDLQSGACSARNRAINGRFDSGTKALIDGVPFVSNFVAAVGATDNKSLCESLRKSSTDFVVSDEATYSPIAAAQANFNQCIEIERKVGVAVTHVQKPSELVFTLTPRSTESVVYLQSVTPSSLSGFECSVSPSGLLSNGVVSGAVNIQVKRATTVQCLRNGSVTQLGDVGFTKTTVVLGLNAGNYSVDIPADTLLGLESRVQASTRIANLTTDLARVEAARKALEDERVRVHHFSVGDPFATNRFSCADWTSGRFSEIVIQRLCPKTPYRRAVVDVNSNRSGGPCGVTYGAVACLGA